MYKGPQKYLKTHLNERGEQVYWSYEITIFFLRKDTDIGTKIQKLFRIKKQKSVIQ